MKYIIFTLCLLSITSVTFAAKDYIRGSKIAEVKPVGLIQTNVYRFDDTNGVSCYFGYMDGNKNVQPTMSCVKVK